MQRRTFLYIIVALVAFAEADDGVRSFEGDTDVNNSAPKIENTDLVQVFPLTESLERSPRQSRQVGVHKLTCTCVERLTGAGGNAFLNQPGQHFDSRKYGPRRPSTPSYDPYDGDSTARRTPDPSGNRDGRGPLWPTPYPGSDESRSGYTGWNQVDDGNEQRGVEQDRPNYGQRRPSTPSYDPNEGDSTARRTPDPSGNRDSRGRFWPTPYPGSDESRSGYTGWNQVDDGNEQRGVEQDRPNYGQRRPSTPSYDPYEGDSTARRTPYPSGDRDTRGPFSTTPYPGSDESRTGYTGWNRVDDGNQQRGVEQDRPNYGQRRPSTPSYDPYEGDSTARRTPYPSGDRDARGPFSTTPYPGSDESRTGYTGWNQVDDGNQQRPYNTGPAYPIDGYRPDRPSTQSDYGTPGRSTPRYITDSGRQADTTTQNSIGTTRACGGSNRYSCGVSGGKRNRGHRCGSHASANQYSYSDSRSSRFGEQSANGDVGSDRAPGSSRYLQNEFGTEALQRGRGQSRQIDGSAYSSSRRGYQSYDGQSSRSSSSARQYGGNYQERPTLNSRSGEASGTGSAQSGGRRKCASSASKSSRMTQQQNYPSVNSRSGEQEASKPSTARRCSHQSRSAGGNRARGRSALEHHEHSEIAQQSSSEKAIEAHDETHAEGEKN